METHRQIIKLWPNRPALARDVGVDEGVVNQWYRRDSIPPEYWPGLAEAALGRGLNYITTDLLLSIRVTKRKLTEQGAEEHAG